MTDGLKLFSAIVGWTYFVAWSGSFYPQAWLNYRRKYVGGLSIDFCALNLLGHISYGAYNIAFYFDRDVQEEYRRRHHGTENTVQVNDVAFSIHASIMASLWLVQTLYYPREPGQRTSTFNRVVMTTYGLIVVFNALRVWSGTESLYGFVSVLSLFKLYVSVGKYVPQAWENYKHQSTDGWSIAMVMLDFSGGLLSFVQLFTDAARTSDWTAVTENPAKFGLSILSMIFTGFYIIQHFIMYPEHHDAHLIGKDEEGSKQTARSGSEEREALLGP